MTNLKRNLIKMWAVLKIDKKKFNLLKQDLQKRLGATTKFYIPKIEMDKYLCNKTKKKIKYDILGDYVFCFCEKFYSRSVVSSLNNLRGLKYFLNGFQIAQQDIKKFIEICLNSENKEGFLTQDFFELKVNQYYKFLNGAFASKIFQLIELEKNRIGFNVGNIKSYIYKKNICFTLA